MAMASISDLVAQVDVHDLFASTKHGRLQAGFARQLSDLIAKGEKERSKVFFDTKFLRWARDNEERATAYADAFIETYIVAQTGMTPHVYTYVRARFVAFSKVGILPSKTMMANVALLRASAVWTGGAGQLEAASAVTNSTQVHTWQKQMSEFVKKVRYLLRGRDGGGQFRIVAEAVVASPPPALEGGAGVTLHVLRGMIKTGDGHLFGLVLKGAAFALFARASGVRAGQLLMSKVDTSLVVLEGQEGIFQRFETRKSGAAAKPARECVVRVVAHKTPALCPLFGLALAVVYIHSVLGDHGGAQQVFSFGAFKNTRQDTIVACESGRRHMVAIIDALAVAAGMPDGINACTDARGTSKLHIFRKICTNEMIDNGASKDERQAHCGWVTSVDDKHYSVQQNIAAAARTPFLLAGRKGLEDPPSALWDLLPRVPQLLIPENLSKPLRFLFRVHILALAGGVPPNGYRESMSDTCAQPVFREFEKLVQAHMQVAERASKAQPPSYPALKRSLQKAKTENILLAKKLKRLQK